MLRRLALAFMVASLACGDPSSPRRVEQPPTDKRALYGDPSLVPTREGERVRRELALAGEIEQALRLFPGPAEVRVHVHADEQSTRVAVFARAEPEVAAGLRTHVDAVASGIVGPDAVTTLTMATPDAAPPPPAPRRGLALGLALLGLGASLGIGADRFARRRRRAR